jgi:hypothetical protein
MLDAAVAIFFLLAGVLALLGFLAALLLKNYWDVVVCFAITWTAYWAAWRVAMPKKTVFQKFDEAEARREKERA